MDNILAMVLAGGVGKRLSILSQLRAKPAVPFGGIYRIIDFTLSNVMNSGIGHIAILPQYKPLSLVGHIGIGMPWDFNGRTRSITILSPSTGKKDSDWYRGTADAIRQNLDYMINAGSKYVLLLSGDHIYSMDYRKLIAYHIEKQADVSIAMIRVPISQANQLGIGSLDRQGRIVAWVEKPEAPKSDLASMGIYVFSTEFLVSMLRSHSGDDFGHDLIPEFVQHHKTYGFLFEDYWRDVGTVKAYWESNMDILSDEPGINLKAWNLATNFDEERRVGDRPPMFIGRQSGVSQALISQGCTILGQVENSVLSPGVVVGRGAAVRNSIVMNNTEIGAGAKLNYCVIDKNVRIGPGCTLGRDDSDADHLCLIGKGARIPANMKIGKFCKVFPMTDLARDAGGEIADFQEVGSPI